MMMPPISEHEMFFPIFKNKINKDERGTSHCNFSKRCNIIIFEMRMTFKINLDLKSFQQKN